MKQRTEVMVDAVIKRNQEQQRNREILLIVSAVLLAVCKDAR